MFISPEEYQILCQQVQPLVPGPIGPYVPGGPGTGPYVPGGPGTGPHVAGGPGTGPYVPYSPYGPGPYVPVIPVPQPPDRPAVVPPLRIVPGMFRHQVGVKNTYPHHTRSSPRPKTQTFQDTGPDQNQSPTNPRFPRYRLREDSSKTRNFPVIRPR